MHSRGTTSGLGGREGRITGGTMKGQMLKTGLLSAMGGTLVWCTILYTSPGTGLWWSSSVIAAATETSSRTNLPAHAILQPGGYGWKCAHGCRREGEHCVRVHVPQNAFLDYFGDDWKCERGYRREGDRCVQVHVPPHSFLDYSGHAWECEHGYQQAGDH